MKVLNWLVWHFFHFFVPIPKSVLDSTDSALNELST